jgi:hypothetical protein
VIAGVLLGLGAAVAALSLLPIRMPGVRWVRWVPIGLVIALVAGAALATATAWGTPQTGRSRSIFVLLGLVAAAVAGSQVVGVVFEAIDSGAESSADAVAAEPAGSLRSAGQVLKGGVWIGVLERIAVFAALMAHWPAGIAIVLAIKGLGRYPELRAGQNSALAERFIIGTLVSVLWAAACVYAAAGPSLG